MNPHHHENLSLPNLQYYHHHHHHHQWHTVMVLLQLLEVDCSGSCRMLQAGSSVGWEDQPYHSMQMSPTLCQRRKCRSPQFAPSLAEEPNSLFAFWSLKKSWKEEMLVCGSVLRLFGSANIPRFMKTEGSWSSTREPSNGPHSGTHGSSPHADRTISWALISTALFVRCAIRLDPSGFRLKLN